MTEDERKKVHALLTERDQLLAELKAAERDNAELRLRVQHLEETEQTLDSIIADLKADAEECDCSGGRY